MLATRRGPAVGGAAAMTGEPSYTAGVDATMLFLTSINLTSYYARTETPTAAGTPSPEPATVAASTSPPTATAPPPSTC